MLKTDYDFLSAFLQQRSGLSLGEKKEYLLESRLNPLAQSSGMNGIEDLVRELRSGKDSRLASAVTEAMTTNETLFFRDKTPFEELRTRLIPQLLEARRNERKLRIWCAATSTGQEPYSLVMLLRETFPELATHWKVEILATDLCSQALQRAEEGIYSQFEVQRGLPIQYLMSSFTQVPTGWQIKPELKKWISFRKMNLMDSYMGLGQFDLVLCRNVLIYFDTAMKKNILDRIAGCMRPDAYLILGAAETVMGITEKLNRCRDCKSAVYATTAKVPALV